MKHAPQTTGWRPRLSEPVRIAIQTAVAAVIAWFAGQLIGREAVTWAVFSAIFVVQGNIGGTIASAAGRVVGALLGILIALAAVFTIGTGDWRTILGLAIGVGLMSLISGWRPSYSYGLVTVAMIIVSPGFEVVENAVERSAGVLTGTIAGALASTLLFPRAARAQSRAAAGRALRGCASLLDATASALVQGRRADLAPIHHEIEDAVADAQKGTRSGRSERFLPFGRRALDPPIVAIQRIWYSLAVLDRLSERPIPDVVADILADPVRGAGQAAVAALEAVAKDLEEGRRPEKQQVAIRLSDLNGAIDRLRTEKRLDGLPRDDVERTLALGFAFEQICRNISELAESFNVEKDRSSGAGG